MPPETTPPLKTTEEALFGGNTSGALQPVFRSRREDLENILGATGDQIAKSQQEYVTAVEAAGLDAYTVGHTLYEAEIAADVADARGLPEDPERQRRNLEHARQQLRARFPHENPDELIARADKWVRQHPRLNHILSRRGNGSRPDLVLPIVETVVRKNFR
jgi:hypothetical protein